MRDSDEVSWHEARSPKTPSANRWFSTAGGWPQTTPLLNYSAGRRPTPRFSLHTPSLADSPVGCSVKQFCEFFGSGGMRNYQCEATSVSGFVQQLACNYLPHGYWLYVTGWIPDRKDPCQVDRKLLAKYRIGISRQARARRKLAGFANLHYLRHGQFFVILATHGRHSFFADEAKVVRDIRRRPIKFAGYSISVKEDSARKRARAPGAAARKWRVHVRIERERYLELKAYFVSVATRWSAELLRSQFHALPFEPYAPVRQQLLNILRLVNKARGFAGFEKIPSDVLRFRRQIVRPFEPSLSSIVAANSALAKGDGSVSQKGER
jgi:hypothetical protein